MGPFSDTQLCISPIFYFTYIDMWGPLAIYCPGYEKRTRNRQQMYEVHILVMGCAVTGTVNCQIIERKDTGAVLDGLNRFFHEVCVPKICYPDKDGALMKALHDGQVDMQDMQGRLHRERGLHFETCLPQGHYQHEGLRGEYECCKTPFKDQRSGNPGVQQLVGRLFARL